MTFSQLFRYEFWATRRWFDRLRALPEVIPEIVGLFAHNLAGLELWALRLEGRESRDVPVWPDLTLDECESRIASLERRYAALGLFEREPTPAELTRIVEYSNQHDLAYATQVGDILWHLLIHGGYHRGQIARRVRELGHDPVNTDYITYVRELAGEEWKP